MRKIAIEVVRRRELIDAALAVLFDGGPDHATMNRIGKRAGMSHGIVNYYFKSKDHLLIEALRTYFDMALQECETSIKEADTPGRRLSAIVRSCFQGTRFTRAAANSWISIYAQFSSNPDFQSVQRSFDVRLTSMMCEQLVDLVVSNQVELVAEAVYALMDGIWHRRAKMDGDETVSTAIAMVEALIDWAIAAHPKGA